MLVHRKICPHRQKKTKAVTLTIFFPHPGHFGHGISIPQQPTKLSGHRPTLFLMSFALVVYLNEVPNTPRERDYVYVGSFYVFSIWIGFGTLFLFSNLQKLMKEKLAIIATLVLSLTMSPLLLLAQNYDDHDRSGRYSARDLARNYLESCAKDAILFTHADNDTYPLWYCQEVEGIRKDVRVVVMPYLSAEWYIGQLQRKIYDNDR